MVFACFLYNERSHVCLISFLEEKKKKETKKYFYKSASFSYIKKLDGTHINKKKYVQV
jgi:hypothetical protein